MSALGALPKMTASVKSSALLLCAAAFVGMVSSTSALPYEALGSIDVGTGESSIFLFNGQRYLLDNIFCGYIDHYGKWNPKFSGHSYARIRSFDDGSVVANVTETIATSFVSAFVDHRPEGDVLWLSALDEDRCHKQCGTGVLALSSTDLKSFTRATAIPSVHTCNTEVAKVYSTELTERILPPHRYVMILEPFTFMINNAPDGNLSKGWMPVPAAKAPRAPSGGPSIRFEGGYYYVITGGSVVMLCRSKDLGASDPWNCTAMVKPTGKGGASGPGDGAIAPYVGFAHDATRKDFPVMQKDVAGWDWNSNDADVCCTGGSEPSFIIWGASTQGHHPDLPPGSPSCTNAIGRANVSLEVLLQSFFL